MSEISSGLYDLGKSLPAYAQIIGLNILILSILWLVTIHYFANHFYSRNTLVINYCYALTLSFAQYFGFGFSQIILGEGIDASSISFVVNTLTFSILSLLMFMGLAFALGKFITNTYTVSQIGLFIILLGLLANVQFRVDIIMAIIVVLVTLVIFLFKGK